MNTVVHQCLHVQPTQMIEPFDSTQPINTVPLSTNDRLMIQAKKLADVWFALQLTHYGGKYSIERMLSLEEYTRNTSLVRVILVSVGVPLSIFALVLGQESVPLQNPTDGWKANHGFWVRVGCLGAVVGYAGASQFGVWLDVPDLSSKQTFVLCLLKAAGFVATGMVAAELWVYPVPFFILSLSIIWPAIMVGFLRLVVGAHAFQQIRSRQEQLSRLNKLGTLQSFLCAAYPAYQVLFNKAMHTRYELAVIIVLPIFRLVMKTIFASAVSHKEDMIPEQVVFTVDFFDAFYLATFMPKFSSTALVVLMMIHLMQTTSELQELHQRTQNILARLHNAVDIDNEANNDLLTALRSLCHYSKPLRMQTRGDIRVHSCLLHRLSPEGRNLLEKLGNHQRSQRSGSALQPSSNLIRVLSEATSLGRVSKFGVFTRGARSVNAIQPVPPLAVVPKAQNIKVGTNGLARTRTNRRQSLNDTSRILQESLEVFFTSECLVLMEYVEIVIPAHYAMYIMAMVQLPSAQYHTEMAGINPENAVSMVSRMLIFALFELVSFIVLALIAKRNCGIHAVYQLGFVLETHMPFVLSKLMLWIAFTLTFRVVHFGADFSFQFEWMKHSRNE